MLKTAKDKTTFLRAFMLLVLLSVLCPGTDNASTPWYLHNLKFISKIKSFDWVGHRLNSLMNEVRKYQSFSSQDEVALRFLRYVHYPFYVPFICISIAITLLIYFIGTTSYVALAIIQV